MTVFALRPLGVLTAAALLAACATAQPVSTAASGAQTGALAGSVMFPAALAADAHIIPTGIGSVISAGGGRLKLLTVAETPSPAPAPQPADLAVSGALVLALDAGTQAPLAGATTRTDANGHYVLGGLDASHNVLLEALFTSPDGKRGFRLLALGRPGGASQAISWRSTAVLGQLGTGANLTEVDPASLAAQEDALAAGLGAQAPATQLEALQRMLGVDPSQVLQAEGGNSSPLPLPPAVPVPGVSPFVAGTVGAVVGTTGQAAGTVGAVASAAVGIAASVLPSLLPASPYVGPTILPAVVDTTLGAPGGLPSLEPVHLATPTPASTPSAAPASPSGLLPSLGPLKL